MIEMVTPMSLVNARIEAYAKKVEASILKKLSFIGESVVAEARSANSYIDQTGNLRSSTGYAILKDGKVLSRSSFLPVKITATKGGKKGKELHRKQVEPLSDVKKCVLPLFFIGKC